MPRKGVCLGLLLSACCLLSSCAKEKVNASEVNHPDWNEVAISEYTARFEEAGTEFPSDMTSIGLFVSQDPDESMIGKTICMEDEEDPIYVTCSYIGPTTTLTLSVYYDYQQIPFRVGEKEDKVDTYSFQLNNREEIKVPMILDGLTSDEERHKLLFSVIGASDRHMSELEEVADCVNITHLCDLIYKENQTDKMSFTLSKSTPERMFRCPEARNLVLNTDYENQELQKNGYPALPKSVYPCKAGSTLELMYTLRGVETSETGLIFVTTDYEQVEINGKDSLLFAVNTEDVCTGRLSIKVPEVPGLYDEIGYAVFDPTALVDDVELHNVEISPRFTLQVE